ncbi:hypothetical protein FDECE_7096 [Fusarium decemcellulare]|nr:hypothetical protein FDECE_7096 [Fusarium decemcellulare]
MATSSTSHTTVVGPQTVVTDLIVWFSHWTVSPSPRELDTKKWHRIDKELYLDQSQQRAWLYIALASRQDLASEDMLVMDISVGERPSDPGSGLSWESRHYGIWLLRGKSSDVTEQPVTKVDVLFGTDAVDPRPQWTLTRSWLQLPDQLKIPVVKLTVLHGAESGPDAPEALRVRKDGTFKIVQISDTHMVTGVGECNDAIDASGSRLQDSVADPLTVNFIGKVLDEEKPDLVVFTGDQLHHDVLDSQSALFKVVAPVIERGIRFTAVFGNHDSEGRHALSREDQMSILQNLPLSFCDSGPEHVDGIGNFHIEVLAPKPSQFPLFTLYFLDSHGGIPDGGYDHIKQSQIDWFTDTSQAQREACVNSGNDDYSNISMVFQHIPIPEFTDTRLKTFSGHQGEPPEGPKFNSGLYDAMEKQGVSAFCVGHDHVNSWCGRLQKADDATPPSGPWLCYGGCSGFGAYCSYDDDRYHRGIRVLEVKTTTGTLETWRRVEYNMDKVDKLVLVEGGVVVVPH